MTIFILFISIIINIVSILAIIILYVRQNRLLNVENEQKKMIKEMEEMFSSYLIEMKDENEEFIKKVRIQQNKNTVTTTILKKVDDNAEQSSYDNIQNIDLPMMTSLKRSQAEKTYQNAIQIKNQTIQRDDQSNIDVLSTLSTDKQIAFLEKEGLSIEQIAQKLNKGKTEIELMLKFRQKQ
jgi:hypothetical protein